MKRDSAAGGAPWMWLGTRNCSSSVEYIHMTELPRLLMTTLGNRAAMLVAADMMPYPKARDAKAIAVDRSRCGALSTHASSRQSINLYVLNATGMCSDAHADQIARECTHGSTALAMFAANQSTFASCAACEYGMHLQLMLSLVQPVLCNRWGAGMASFTSLEGRPIFSCNRDVGTSAAVLQLATLNR